MWNRLLRFQHATFRAAFVAVLALAPASDTWAAGTPAGTDITNQATATYDVGSTTLTQVSNVTTTRVAELLNVSVIWQDASNVQVNSGDTDRILTFLVTNTGNGTDEYTLAGLTTLGGDDFDPALGDLYLDANGNGTYDSGVDDLYVSGSNDPALSSDSSLVVFSLSDIPPALSDGDLGDSQLTASSNTGSGPPGTVIAGAGEGSTDAVVGTTGGEDSDTGTYVVSTVTVSVVKSVAVSDPFGGSEPVPGAVLTYTIVVDVTGSDTARSVVVTDPIPSGTSYNPATVTLNAAALTDAVDGDAGDVGGTTPATVTVALGDLADASPPQTITFDVTID